MRRISVEKMPTSYCPVGNIFFFALFLINNYVEVPTQQWTGAGDLGMLKHENEVNHERKKEKTALITL